MAKQFWNQPVLRHDGVIRCCGRIMVLDVKADMMLTDGVSATYEAELLCPECGKHIRAMGWNEDMAFNNAKAGWNNGKGMYVRDYKGRLINRE